ncbi:hypothetical protein [Nocardia sp. NPDC056000]|uniref:hypothetical protein n=1 Tax=Nocardia sp. NPDC056000 TaxID=3345674 RepID=UPI0035DDDCD2
MIAGVVGSTVTGGAEVVGGAESVVVGTGLGVTDEGPGTVVVGGATVVLDGGVVVGSACAYVVPAQHDPMRTAAPAIRVAREVMIAFPSRPG